MATHNLRITFAGICVHFRDLVPGIPHRVVLPDGAAMFLGALRVGPKGPERAYSVMPHYAFLKAATREEQRELTVPELLDEGLFLTGARLQLLNPIGAEITYDVLYETTPALADYVARYDYSENVVSGGRAALYVDLFNGFVSPVMAKGGAKHVAIDLQTDGPPAFRVIPLDNRDTLTRSGTVTLRGETLTIANMEVGTEGDPRADFVLHYLTAQRGIPQILERPTPGLDDPDPARPLDAVALQLAELLRRGRPSPDDVWNAAPDELTASCSDSRYP
jgi:hypothetical protein